ncbi:MAG: 1-(5-phosphoribosyl)-5-[(5-phosphoribosylamino)methylideneamino]imidazole-4-carboxamide isomerase [Desulfobacula sp. RIFOXYA12_FULL_46_16]|nr:MAG: 1-(5-phosphoribosyl)-5-[(5-phosphoribosylamino)methylideneamino]imidazole-4-carboxamide isomerase [Deltaproteobacteria bacterium RIFOXYC2_FULL_48_10]OGR20978.1 MAG: 1-(5-phosphoribosyl)-5-[(5-phosphoribosylamino)methylideneamino]imidazole-4-carboxamide isomerase [Desulfobacula sp. RIFOXYA12_FULL_46_16]OGR40529.1 MAG: 1-(5-phosphoribosyl)-5-[(5-phosphoribosylamino)methylideneamino]imidazole-4-carboxamide isomerase [Desulfobacula sp. RIFOXYB2_FULL_45_6]
MIIIPAVDIKQGKCVRLLQGRMEDTTQYSEDPLKMAQRWEKEGASLIHVVDLDGAFAKEVRNLKTIQTILSGITVPIQVGGGIRDLKTIELYINMGVSRIIIGSEAVYNPNFVKEACLKFKDRIVVGIDARNGKVAVEGWSRTSETKAVDLAKEFESCGVVAINFTDIYRDGMQTGPNIEETAALAEAVTIPIIASGGVSTIQDIKNLLKIESKGVAGVITGKALYEGTLDLKEAIRISK